MDDGSSLRFGEGGGKGRGAEDHAGEDPGPIWSEQLQMSDESA